MQKTNYLKLILTAHLFVAGVLSAEEEGLPKNLTPDIENAEGEDLKPEEEPLAPKLDETKAAIQNDQRIIKIGIATLGLCVTIAARYFLKQPCAEPPIIFSNQTFSLKQEFFDCSIHALTNAITHAKTVFSAEDNQKSFTDISTVVFEDLKTKVENLLILLNLPVGELEDQFLLINLGGATSYSELFRKYIREDAFSELQNRFAETIYQQNKSLCPSFREFGLNIFLTDMIDALKNKHSFEQWWSNLNYRYINGESADMSSRFQLTKEKKENIWRNNDGSVYGLRPGEKIQTEQDVQIFTWLKQGDTVSQQDFNRAVDEKKLSKDVLITNSLSAAEYLDVLLQGSVALNEQVKIAFQHLFETGRIVLPVLFNRGGHYICVAIDLNEAQPIFVRDSCNIYNNKPTSLTPVLQKTINDLQNAFKVKQGL